MADLNNDGYNDIFVTEMLPSDYQRLKTVTTFEDWNKYQYNVKMAIITNLLEICSTLIMETIPLVK